MTYQDIVSEMRQLPLREKLLLLEELTQTIRAELTPQPTRTGSSVDRVRGIAKPEGPPPTDDEIKDSYVQYLLEKY